MNSYEILAYTVGFSFLFMIITYATFELYTLLRKRRVARNKTIQRLSAV